MAKHKSPSRRRYEEQNPVVSARVPREYKNRLAQLLEAAGKSYSQWLKEAIDDERPHRREVKLARLRGYEEGVDDGAALGFDMALAFCDLDNFGEELLAAAEAWGYRGGHHKIPPEPQYREQILTVIEPDLDYNPQLLVSRKRKRLGLSSEE